MVGLRVSILLSSAIFHVLKVLVCVDLQGFLHLINWLLVEVLVASASRGTQV